MPQDVQQHVPGYPGRGPSGGSGLLDGCSQVMVVLMS